MFTGLIEAVGKVAGLSGGGESARLRVDAGALADGLAVGDSVAVEGACLTVAEVSGGAAEFDVSTETLRRTTLGDLRPGDGVNLERALRVGDRLGGHFVLGHVDCVGTMAAKRQAPGQVTVEVRVTPEIVTQLIPKGSVAVDGISLTLAELKPDGFSVAVIPHTLEQTTLGQKSGGARVNIELDVIGKYVARLLRGGSGAAGDLSEGFLAEHGFK